MGIDKSSNEIWKAWQNYSGFENRSFRFTEDMRPLFYKWLGITPNMIKGKGYHFYTFSRTIKLTAPTILFGGSWRLNFRIGSKVFHDDAAAAEKEYIVHVSLKFEKDRVFCDRVILQEKVKFPPKILPENLKKLPSSDVIVIESDANAKNSVFCSDGSCGRALFEKIDTKKAAYNFGIYHQKTKNYGSSSIGINYKTAKKNEVTVEIKGL